MFVGINAVSLDMSCGSGEARYLRALLDKMREARPDARFLILTDPANNEAFEGWERECVATTGLGLFGGLDARINHAARQHGVETLFSSIHNAPLKPVVPSVLYALDLRPYGEEQKANRRSAQNAKRAKSICEAASSIVVSSEYLQRRLLEIFETPLNKTIVAPLGIDPAFENPSEPPLDEPYLLTVGGTHRFRNVPRLREAFDLLKTEIPHVLVVVGAVGEDEPQDWGERVIRVEKCPTTHLASLYRNCSVFIQPSVNEGSGVTVLEALCSGAPVVASRTGGIPEVAGDMPIYFNHESVSSMVSSTRWAIDEKPEQRRARAKLGHQFLAEFSWEKCAWKTLSAFKPGASL
jgi:alpha-1,3-rhamnosyl/mannosyltransferase